MFKSKAIGVEFKSYLDLKDNRCLSFNMMRNPRLKERSKLASNVEVWSRNNPEKYSTQNRTLPHCRTLTLHSFSSSSSSPSLFLGFGFGEREEERNPKTQKEKRKKMNGWIKIGPWKLEETILHTIQLYLFLYITPKIRRKGWKILFLFIFYLLLNNEKQGRYLWAMNFYILWTIVHEFGGIWLAENSEEASHSNALTVEKFFLSSFPFLILCEAVKSWDIKIYR